MGAKPGLSEMFIQFARPEHKDQEAQELEDGDS